MTALDFALKYAERGWPVFPLRPRSKEPLSRQDLANGNGEGGLKVATTDTATIRQWFARWPNANLGIATGRQAGFVVLDIDAGHGGSETILTLQAEHGKLPEAPESLTGGGGRHILFAYPGGVDIRNSAGKLGPGLDIRGEGGYIMAPPSIHPNGKPYQWEPSCLPSKIPLPAMPQWMLDLLAEKPAPTPAQVSSDHIIHAGQRDQTLASLAGSMRRRGMGADEILAALVVTNQTRCDPPLAVVDVERIAKSVSRYDPQAPANFPGEGQVDESDPLDAYGGLAIFLDTLDNLEGRSIYTYIRPIDAALGGFERQTLSVLAARPSMGKSTLAWQIARNVAASGLVAYFFSLEMSATALWAKAACGACGLRWRRFRAGEATPEEKRQVVEKALELMDTYRDKILVNDHAQTSQSIWESVEKYRPDFVLVDHLRLVADRNESEVRRLGGICKTFKDLSKARNCHVMTLAQLNRGVEARDNKRPQMSDFRDSGEIEETADTAIMMYRADYYDDDRDANKLMSETELLVRKFRDDIPQQKIILPYDLRHQWFGDLPITEAQRV